MNRLLAFVEFREKFAYLEDLANKHGLNFQFIDKLADCQKSEESTLLLLELTECEKLSTSAKELTKSLPNTTIGMITSNQSNLEKVECLIKCHSVSHIFFDSPERMKIDLDRVLQLYMSDTESRKQWLPELENLSFIELSSSEDRWSCYDKVEAYINKLDCFSGFSDIACTMVSELLTNAFYDAPKCEKTGMAKFPNRRSQVDIDPPSKVTFWYGIDNEYFWMIVEDPFGTLDKTTLVAALYRAAKEKAPNWNNNVGGGAGLGLYMILDACSEVLFNLSKDKTKVGCKLRLTKRYRQFVSEQTSLHIIENN